MGKLAGGLSSVKLKNVLPQSKLCDVYRALFESHLCYVNAVWGNLSSTELQTQSCLQTRALSVIESARFKDPWPKKWLIVDNLIRFDRSVLVYKIWNMFHYRSSLSNHNTGNDKDLHIPKVKLDFSEKTE